MGVSESNGDAFRLALAAIGAAIVLAGFWYAATLRTENAMLREQLARYEAGAAMGDARGRAGGESAAPAGAARIAARPQRMLSDEQRAAMRVELGAEPGRKVWFETQARDPEASAFQSELEAVFQESGWQVGGSSEADYRIKAGVYVFMADEEPQPYVSTVLRGLEAAGLEVFAGSGYRAFYEQKKQEDPSFRGHELGPEQDFVIVVGPNPDSAS